MRPLARIRRYAGQCPLPLSVAEHSVRGARAIVSEHHGEAVEVVANAAAWFLVHDAHEVFSGDFTRPFQIFAEVRSTIGAAQAELDLRIAAAAGLAAPAPVVAAIVAGMDNRMGAEERRRLWGPDAERDPADEALAPVDIDAWRTTDPTVWTEHRAAIEWILLWNALRVGRHVEVPFYG